MRILVVTLNREVVGGVETYLRELLPALCSRGHQVALLHENEPHACSPTIDEKSPGLFRWNCSELGYDRALQEALNWKPDIAFSHGISSSTTATGLQVEAVLLPGTYVTGQKVPDREMEGLRLRRHKTCPKWNYTIKPRKQA